MTKPTRDAEEKNSVEMNTQNDQGDETKTSHIPSTELRPTSELDAAWTPGPWVVKKARTILHVGPVDGHVCEVSLRPSIRGVERPTIEAQALADARLIAAAPALYEALKSLIAHAETTCTIQCRYLKSARTALALVEEKK